MIETNCIAIKFNYHIYIYRYYGFVGFFGLLGFLNLVGFFGSTGSPSSLGFFGLIGIDFHWRPCLPWLALAFMVPCLGFGSTIRPEKHDDEHTEQLQGRRKTDSMVRRECTQVSSLCVFIHSCNEHFTTWEHGNK